MTVLSSTCSTNDDLKKLALEGAPHGTVVMALSQSQGRGRLGRVFSSEEGGVYVSYLVRNPLSHDAVHLTVSAAVAAARALEYVSGVCVGIKWVNDLFFYGKKCGGILVEGVYDGESPSLACAVIGIGINLYNPLPEELKNIAISVKEAGGNWENGAILAAQLVKELGKLTQIDAPLPIEEYRARSILIGKKVDVVTPCTTYEAEVISILDDASLKVRVATGEEIRLGAGEVRLKMN